jgi:catechol 2,3-dioxygenase-like lactoylglutathione lyase family enzyme
MDPRISFVTLAVADLEPVRAFYLTGLGWPAVFDDGDEVVMIQAGPQLVLSLWQRDAFAAEVGYEPVQGRAPLTLAHNVATRAEVDEVLAAARAAGALEVSAPQERAWGGYTGYFADPDGFRWEVAWNPGPVGQLVLPDEAQTERAGGHASRP